MRRKLHPLLAVAAAAGLILALAACDGDTDAPDGGDAGNAAPPDPAGDTFTVVTAEFSFTPDTLTVSADQSVTVAVDNSGGVVEHDFTLDEADVYIHADPGQTESDSFSVPAGSYTFYCAVPGHREAGMTGTLTAE